MTPPASDGGPAGDRAPSRRRGTPLRFGDEDLLAILEEAIADERAAQEKYRRGLERCADPEACEVFEQLLREERAHENALRRATSRSRSGSASRAPAGAERRPGLRRTGRGWRRTGRARMKETILGSARGRPMSASA